MSDYESELAARRAANKATKAKTLKLIAEVAALLGATCKVNLCDDGHLDDRVNVNLTLKSGARMWLHAGGWKMTGRAEVSCDTSYRTADGKTISARDVGAMVENTSQPSMTCSLDKGAEAIAKDISRRVLAYCESMHEVMLKKVSERDDFNARRARVQTAANAFNTATGAYVRHVGSETATIELDLTPAQMAAVIKALGGKTK